MATKKIVKTTAKKSIKSDKVLESSGRMFGNIANILKVDPSRQSYFMMMNVVSYETVQPIIEWILESNFAEEQPDTLTLLVCSPGGELAPAMALIDIMRGSSIPVATVAVGEIASAGTMITMAGQKGKRFSTTNTSIMSHQYSGGHIGKHHELIPAVKDFELTDARIIRLYQQCTGLDERKIREILLPPHDVYLTPEEAKKYGIIDVIRDLN